jgi:hypothetical protein
LYTVKWLSSSALVLLLAIGLGPAGCVDAGWENGGTRASGAAIPPMSGWRATGDAREPALAIDGAPGTAAVLADGGSQITIDLGKPSMFNMVVVDHGSVTGGYPRRLAVLTSMDGRTFTQRHVAAGTPRYTTLCLFTPTLARYVRLQTVTPGNKPWNIAEVYLY